VKGNGDSFAPATSADGTLVAFQSFATNLHPADGDQYLDVYLKNLSTGLLTLLSASDSGMKGNGDSFAPAISADGTRVAFASDATNLDPADSESKFDVYVKRVSTGDIALASRSAGGTNSNGDSLSPALSDDGGVVAFDSSATNLIGADSDSISDIYTKELATGALNLVSTSANGTKGNGDSYGPSISSDGQVVAFQSAARNLHGDDADALQDIYVKDLPSGDITLASTSDSRVKGDGGSVTPTISGNGSAVAFHSVATNLDPVDTDAISDVYVKEVGTGDITLASLSEDGRKGNGSSLAPSLAGDGTVAGFDSTSSNLHPDDTDEVEDIYVKELGPPGILADLELAVVDAPDPVQVGSDITWTATVTNHGPDDATGVGLTASLAAGMVLLSAETTQGTCSGTTTITCDLAVVGSTSVIITIVATPTRTGTPSLPSSLTSDSNDPNPSNNADDEPTRTYGKTCTMIGTQEKETIIGTDGTDVICALGRNDTLKGGLLGDTLYGGEGADNLFGQDGADSTFGGNGDDDLEGVDGVNGNDKLTGGVGIDECTADPGDSLKSCE
nr:PD40 domain-containing protein [Actinomycetota bacterium]